MNNKQHHLEKDVKNKNTKSKASKNGVIITVYVESPNPKSNSINKINPNPFSRKPQTARNCGYDRRAQLLAYARELREMDSNLRHVQWDRETSRPKINNWRFHVSVPRIFQRKNSEMRYERIVSEEIASTTIRQSGKKKKSSHICRRLKGMMQQLLCGWHCNKGK